MASVILAGTTSTTALNLTGDTSGELQLKTNNGSTTAMTLTTAGNVGIGTASPSFPLDISAASGTTARIKSTGNYSYLRLDTTSATGGGALTCWQNGSQKALFGVSGAALGDTSGDAIIYAETGQGIRFTANGTSEAMRINASGGVGIGTSTIPAFTKLQVTGTAGAQTGANQQIQVSAPTTTAGQGAGIRLNAASGAKEAVAVIGVVNEASGNSGALVFHNYAGGADIPERMRITSAGDVLINATSNSFYANSPKLTVVGGASPLVISNGDNSGTFLRFDTGADNGIITINANARSGSYPPLAFQTSDNERMRIRANGQVIVSSNGSTTSDRQFVVDTNSAESVSSVFRGGSAESYIGFRGTGVANDYQVMCGINNTSFAIFTANTERMRIDSSGNLIVAKTTTADTTVGATMQNSGRIAGTMAASTNATDTMTVYSTGAGLYRFYLGMGGTIYATSTTITGISDQRLKENIVDLPDGLDAVMALKPRKFDWKEGKGKNIKGDRGFIAQEFETVFPDMIETWKDPAPEGEEPYKGVNPNLIPTLVKAIQEQQAIITDLKQRIETLEAK